MPRPEAPPSAARRSPESSAGKAAAGTGTVGSGTWVATPVHRDYPLGHSVAPVIARSEVPAVSIRTRVRHWPVLRQLTTADHLGRGTAVRSAHTEELTPRTRTADRIVQSVCPYCAVGCGQRVYVKSERVIQIEGDPDSPISRGRLCPKGAASEQLVNGPSRVTTVKYRRPFGTDWEELPLARAMEM